MKSSAGRLVALLSLAIVSFAAPHRLSAAALPYSPPVFSDPNRRQKLEALLPEVDQIFREVAAARHIPGITYGVMLDGQLIHARSLGLANVEKKIPAASDTRFRIASMTKSFVAMAALKLRDEGKLRLDDPVVNYLPAVARMRPPTSDSPVITIRHLMTMTTGLPEDNPWGDQIMSISADALWKLVNDGLSFSNPSGQQFEYSNLGFALLGQVVSKVAGMPFQKYITENILRPLGMKDTVWEYTTVPADKLALGYRWEHETWSPEIILHDGEGAGCSGIITTLDDFSRYVAFHLSAWPARDAPESGPVRRSTVREMHLPSAFSGLASLTLLDGKTPNPTVTFYDYGLTWRREGRGVVSIAHSGGLPGYGSNYRFAPDHGVAVIAFCNLTYGPMSAAVNKAFSVLLERSNLPPRAVVVSAILETRKRQVADLIQSWDPALEAKIIAMNFYLDHPREDRMRLAREQLALIGRVVSVGAIRPENQLRGVFPIVGEKGTLNVSFTLTPESDPKVQALTLTVANEK